MSSSQPPDDDRTADDARPADDGETSAQVRLVDESKTNDEANGRQRPSGYQSL